MAFAPEPLQRSRAMGVTLAPLLLIIRPLGSMIFEPFHSLRGGAKRRSTATAVVAAAAAAKRLGLLLLWLSLAPCADCYMPSIEYTSPPVFGAYPTGGDVYSIDGM